MSSSADWRSPISSASLNPAYTLPFNIAYTYTVGMNTTNYKASRILIPSTLSVTAQRMAFFSGEVPLSNGVSYLQFANGAPFGYYSYLTDPRYIYHFDLGYEYLFDANDGKGGIYLYDFASKGFFYTSASFAFPYLYDFSLNAVLYYYPDSKNPGRYTSNPRYFFNFKTGQIITK